MATADLNTKNVIAVTEADLRDEQKQAMARAMEEYKQLCLKSFSVNRSGEVIQKQELPMPRQVKMPILVNYKTWLTMLLIVL